jgi:uncharacterized protein
MLGVLLGSLLGARVLAGAGVPMLRMLFGLVVAALGVEMLVKGFRGTL